MKFFRDIKEDLKKDGETLNKLLDGQIDVKKRCRQIGGEIKKPSFWVQNSLTFFVILLSFCVGFWVASQYYQSACNEHMVDTFYELDYYGNIVGRKDCDLPVANVAEEGFEVDIRGVISDGSESGDD